LATVIDISNVNGAVDWNQVRGAGINAAYIKLSEGVTFDDPESIRHARAARDAGVPFGFYHFARPDNNEPEAEAAHVFRRLDGLEPDLRLALDMEQGNPRASYADWAHRFSQAVHARLGYFPVFYSYGPYIEAMELASAVGSGLWLAAYGRNDGIEHPFTVPAPWRRTIMHQFSSRCRVVGCGSFVDLSHASSLRPLRMH
jgi:lysozyme